MLGCAGGSHSSSTAVRPDVHYNDRSRDDFTLRRTPYSSTQKASGTGLWSSVLTSNP